MELKESSFFKKGVTFFCPPEFFTECETYEIAIVMTIPASEFVTADAGLG